MTDITAAEAQELEATTDHVAAELNGHEIRVLLPTKWRMSCLRALRAGDVDTWAEGVIHADDLGDFVDADPTLEEVGEFAARAMSATGEAPGKSGRPSTSTRGTRRK